MWYYYLIQKPHQLLHTFIATLYKSQVWLHLHSHGINQSLLPFKYSSILLIVPQRQAIRIKSLKFLALIAWWLVSFHHCVWHNKDNGPSLLIFWVPHTSTWQAPIRLSKIWCKKIPPCWTWESNECIMCWSSTRCLFLDDGNALLYTKILVAWHGKIRENKDKFHQISTWKIGFRWSIYTKDFSPNKSPKFARFLKPKNSKSSNFYDKFQ